MVAATEVTRLGLGHPFFMRISHAQGMLEPLILRLQERREVRFITTIVGSSDLAVEMVLPKGTHFGPFIEEVLDGTGAQTNTAFITHAFTSGHFWKPQSSVDSPRCLDLPDDSKTPPVSLSQSEAKVLGLLMHDGRTPLSRLAEAIGKSESTASRIIDSLSRAGVLEYRILVEPANLGYNAELMLFAQVEPSSLHQAAVTLAAQDETKYLATTTGEHNLLGQVALTDYTDVYNYSTRTLGAVPGIRSFELALQVDTRKRVWTSISNGRFESSGRPLDLLEYLAPGGE